MLSNARVFLTLFLGAAMTVPCLAQLQIACFAPGVEFDCSEFAPAFCDSLGTPLISPSDTIARCFNGPTTGNQCLFTIANFNSSTVGSPVMADCMTALSTVAVECPQGGSGQFTGAPIRYWMDPNNGVCGHPGLGPATA